MWFISYLEHVSIFAKNCSSITWSDLNYKSFTFTPTSRTSSEPERTILHFFPGTPEQRYDRGAVKRVEGNESFKKQKIVTNNACFCSAIMSTSKVITNKLWKTTLKFLGMRIAALNTFPVILDKPWNYL